MTEENKDILSAKRTIDKEIEALRMMESELDDTLTKALDIMQATKGRVTSPAWENRGISAGRLPQRWPRPARRLSLCTRPKPVMETSAC